MRFFVFAARSLPTRFAGIAMPCVLASAVVAALIVHLTASPGPTPVTAAGAEMMAMLRTEHALVADYVSGATQAQRNANVAAEQDVAGMKVVAAERVAATEKLAVLETPETEMKPLALAAANRPRKLVTREPEQVGPPLQLAAMMNPMPAPPRPSGNVVTSRVRAVVAVVQRVPSWVREATNWMVDLPAQSLPPWLDRRFQHISS